MIDLGTCLHLRQPGGYARESEGRMEGWKEGWPSTILMNPKKHGGLDILISSDVFSSKDPK